MYLVSLVQWLDPEDHPEGTILNKHEPAYKTEGFPLAKDTWVAHSGFLFGVFEKEIIWNFINIFQI